MRSFNSLSDGNTGRESPGRLLPLPFQRCEAGGSDAELLLALRRGHPGAAILLFDRHAEQVACLLERILGKEPDLDHRVASVFKRLLSWRSRIVTGPSLGDFVLRATVWEARKALWMRRPRSLLRRLPWRSWRSPTAAARVATSSAGSPEARLYEALDHLSPDVRVAFCLGVMSELPLSQLAHACGCSPRRARARLSLGIRSMGEHLEPLCRVANLD